MVNSVYAYNMENTDPGLFIFLATCNPGVKAEDVEAKLLEQINKLKTELVTQKELDKLKINVKSDQFLPLKFKIDISKRAVRYFMQVVDYNFEKMPYTTGLYFLKVQEIFLYKNVVHLLGI